VRREIKTMYFTYYSTHAVIVDLDDKDSVINICTKLFDLLVSCLISVFRTVSEVQKK